MIGRVALKKGTFPQNGDLLTVLVFENELKKNSILNAFDPKSKKCVLEKIKTFNFQGKGEESLSFENLGKYQRIILVGAGKKTTLTPISLREKLANVVRVARKHKVSSMDLFLDDMELSSEIGKHLGLALYLANYSFIKYKGEKDRKKHHVVKEINIHLPEKTPEKVLTEVKKGVKLSKVLAEGVYLTRDLVNEPASNLGPNHMVEIAKQIAKQSNGAIKVTVLDEAECRKLGMEAFLGVAQGSDQKPKFIILQAGSSVGGRKKTAAQKTVCLIGKTIMFDSGGLSLKPSSAMEDMKMDMAGGATVLGAFKVLIQDPPLLSTLSKKIKLYGIIPACENMPSGKALKPGDVVQALNGKTIEVLNTDAEGRLALADALSYAEKYLKPDYIVDLATLTGACMVALGPDLAGLFSNDKEFGKTFREITKSQGDSAWPLPLYKPYAKGMKSPVADLKNITGKGLGGAITAALFLSEFVSKAKWIHIDIAGPAFRNVPPEGTKPQGGTGWGVLSLVEYLTRLITN